MAESSYPQPGLKPGDGPDCGAYTANQWRGYNVAKMRASGMIQSAAPVLPTAAQYPDVGVFYAVPNRLEVTSPGASQISIATGASLVDGTLHYSDTAHTAVAITGPGANPRIDVVVVRQNYTGIDYQSVNTPAGTLLVTANTARIAIISGAENAIPVAPALVQDTTRATYWDIPLAQYQIAVGGAITNLTDRREWVDAETKQLSLQPWTGRNVTDGTDIIWDSTSMGLLLSDNKICQTICIFAVPKDFIAAMAVKHVHRTGLNGNAYVRTLAAYGECTQSPVAHSDDTGYQAIALAATVFNCIQEQALTAVGIDDIVTVWVYRDATDVLDTINADTRLDLIIVEYLGWGRK